MSKNILIALALCFGILLGMMIQSKPEIREIVLIEKVDVPYLDLTLPKEEQEKRLEAFANTLNYSLYKYPDIQAIKDTQRRNKQEIEDYYRQKEYELRNKEHSEYMLGVKDGYRDAMKKGE